MNKDKILFVILFLFFNLSQAQKVGWKKLGTAEKLWVITHPFSAKKAKALTKEAITIADSVAKAENWTILTSGGEKDAFRHAYWMALLAERIGPVRARSLGLAHEKKNRKDFKEGINEQGAIPDLRSEQMDLFNNEYGIFLAKQCENCKKKTFINKLVSAIESGELKIIKMDKHGNSLDNEGNVILRKEWEGKWINNRTLVSSDYHLKPKSKVNP